MRGLSYFHSGAVRLKHMTEKGAVFSVQGSTCYSAQIDWSAAGRGLILLRCSCPHYAEENFCKHLWASLMTLDVTDRVPAIQGGDRLKALHDYDVDDTGAELIDLDEYEDKDEDVDDDDGANAVRHVNEVRLPSRLLSAPGLRPTSTRSAPPSKPVLNKWAHKLDWIRRQNNAPDPSVPKNYSGQTKNPREGWYAISIPTTYKHGMLAIEFFGREQRQDGSSGALKHMRVTKSELGLYSDALDREIMMMLFLGLDRTGDGYRGAGYEAAHGQAFVTPALQRDLIPRLARSGRLLISDWAYGVPQSAPVTFDDGDPWRLELTLNKDPYGYGFGGRLKRGEEKRDIKQARVILRSGVVVFSDRIGWLDADRDFGWMLSLRDDAHSLSVPHEQGHQLVETLLKEPSCPPVDWPEELKWKNVSVEPKPTVVISSPPARSTTRGFLLRLDAEYGEKRISTLDACTHIPDRDSQTLYLRDLDKERALIEKLGSLGLTPAPKQHQDSSQFQVHTSDFAMNTRAVLSWGWAVEAEGKKVRQSEDFEIGVSSGVDWFDLKGSVKFSGGFSVGLPALLDALKRNDRLIPLGDGTWGMPPEEWLKKFAPLAALGEKSEENIRFTKSQGIFLQLWLAQEKEVTVDREFAKLKKNLESFSKLEETSPGDGFRGKLRGYQKEGLSWLKLLKTTGIGGILADDMGIGKTVQCLAHLSDEYAALKRKGSKTPHRPSLVILPKSLLFNWREEAARFAPSLRVLCHNGTERGATASDIMKHDLVLMTYATVRIDFELLREIEFHYVIADEAQAIKNADSLSAKACKFLRGRHKLALTGTPVENSIDDLFSIMEFVSPGLLGPNAQSRMSRATVSGKLDAATLEPLSRALKPFILRRTKSQVLKDLPMKTEKVLHCELSASEMKAYTGLRDYYRMNLKKEIASKGIARSKIVILEALLRLRQAACHPGLIDRKNYSQSSTKLDTLTEQLTSVIAEGHKALVFSQFTSFLDIVRRRLDREKIPYEYLDGKTQDREVRVKRFQEDTKIKVFLISLKAGGVGLNLTAADYVFILDPWWNPAVETQAIDRTHRIGQTKKVIAYRLIAQNTVEEKILSLQETKRELADAIVNADRSLLRKITSEDIEVLLS